MSNALVVASGHLGSALTRSNGTQLTRASTASMASTESNREVFLSGREDRAWEISRYLFKHDLMTDHTVMLAAWYEQHCPAASVLNARTARGCADHRGRAHLPPGGHRRSP